MVVQGAICIKEATTQQQVLLFQEQIYAHPQAICGKKTESQQ